MKLSSYTLLEAFFWLHGGPSRCYWNIRRQPVSPLNEQKKKFMSVRAQVSNANEFKLHSFAQSYIIHDHTVVMA